MSSPDLSFQEVVASETLAALPTTRTGAQPPADGTLPYVQFGQSEVSDTFAIGHELILEVHTWSKLEGPHEIKTMQHAIREALHGMNFEKNEWLFTCVREDTARSFLDVGGETWHGIQRFRAQASIP